jgi:formylglycine-generating enzyme required for sulfatase activity
MSEPALSPFDYESITVDSQGKIVGRQAHTAQAFVERLPGSASLELVAIPAGRFSMGSPRRQGSDDERPQRPVSVGRFFMAVAW